MSSYVKCDVVTSISTISTEGALVQLPASSSSCIRQTITVPFHLLETPFLILSFSTMMKENGNKQESKKSSKEF